MIDIYSQYAILPLISSIFVCGLGLFVYFNNRKSPQHLIFLFFSLAIFIWLLGSYHILSARTDEAILFWDRFIYMGVVFISALLYHFGLIFCKIKNQKNILYAGYTLALFFLVISRTDYFVDGVFWYDWGAHALAQFWHHIFLIYFAVYFILFFINLYRYKPADALEKKQKKYVFAAFFILFTIGPLAYFPAYGIPIFPFTFLVGLPFVIILAYAITKHHLFEVKVILTELLVFVIWLASIMEFLLATTVREQAVKGISAVLFIVFGAFLIKNILAEVERREALEVITKKLRAANQKLKETQERELEKAKQVAQLKDEFVFIAAHELRTPVTAIRGFLELVHDAVKHFPKDARDHLDAVALASEHLNQLINDLLEVARSDAGTMKVDVEPLDVVPIVHEILKEIASLADKKQVKVHTKISKKIPMVLGDEKKMKEVVMNILSNAIKYNKQEGDIFVSIFKQGDRLIMEFRDTGYGIPKDQQEKMFQKFFRAHAEGTETVIGTGLGMFVVRILVEKMGGKISFSSVEGEGTTFAISLAIAK